MTRLRSKRLEVGMKQIDVAESAGVTAAFMSDLEIGRRTAKPETWERIASALGCSVEDIKEPTPEEQS